MLCVDEKTQIQAFDRSQPLLPMGLGYVRGCHPRHKARHRHQEFLSVLRRIEKEVPPERDVHLIVDNPMHSQARQSPLLVGAATTLPRPLLAELRILSLSRLNAGLESILSERYDEEVAAVSRS